MRARQVLAVMIGMLVVGATALAEGAPKLQFDKMIYDFGTMVQVDQLKGTFVFTNAGDAVLKIQKPQPSCGCTVVKAEPETLQPGEKGELSFTVNVPQITGHIEKYITVPSNDTNSPMQRLTIKADIQKTYDVTPQQMYIGVVSEGATTNVTFTLRRVDNQKLVLTKVESDSPMLIGEDRDERRNEQPQRADCGGSETDRRAPDIFRRAAGVCRRHQRAGHSPFRFRTSGFRAECDAEEAIVGYHRPGELAGITVAGGDDAPSDRFDGGDRATIGSEQPKL